MEHIVQFAVGIDDVAIVNKVEEHAEKEIIASIKQQVVNKLFESRYYKCNADPRTDELSSFSKTLVDKFLNEHEDEIVSKAAEYLAAKIIRRKSSKSLRANSEGE